MADDLTGATTQVRQNIKDTSADASLSDSEIQEQIRAALRTHSKYRPRELLHTITATGSVAYDFALPSSWVVGFSNILGPRGARVEYPAGEQVPTTIEDGDWMIYDGVDPPVFRMLSTPASGEAIRFRYSAPHYLTAATGTPTSILDTDWKAFIALATAYCCDVLANRASGYTDSTIDADSVNYRDSQLRYKQQGETWRKLYYDHIGAKPGEVNASSATADWDPQASWGPGTTQQFVGGRDFLTHTARRR